MQYIQAWALTKQIFFWCFDAGLEHMAARSRGNGTNFDWLRESCDISTYDLSPDGNLEKYGRSMKSAINTKIVCDCAIASSLSGRTMYILANFRDSDTHRAFLNYASSVEMRKTTLLISPQDLILRAKFKLLVSFTDLSPFNCILRYSKSCLKLSFKGRHKNSK